MNDVGVYKSAPWLCPDLLIVIKHKIIMQKQIFKLVFTGAVSFL